MRRFITTAITLLAVNAYAEYNPNTPIIVQRAKAAIVYIEIFNDNGQKTGEATGWIARCNAGYAVVTNAHVVTGNYNMRLTTLLGRTLHFEEWDGYHQELDISIMRIKDDDSEHSLADIALSVSLNDAREGEHILVIGNPEGVTGTVSDGMVSAVRQHEFLITAPISPGSSGSPVLNDQGEVVGMVKAFFREGQNLNLCVPLAAIRGMLASAGTNLEIHMANEPAPPVSNRPIFLPKQIAPPSDDNTGATSKIITGLAVDFANNLAEGKIDRRHFTVSVAQWYDQGRLSIDEVMRTVQQYNRRWPQQRTNYDGRHMQWSIIPNANGYLDVRCDIPFTWTGTNRKGQTVKVSNVMHVVICESVLHNGRHIEAVYNGNQGNWP